MATTKKTSTTKKTTAKASTAKTTSVKAPAAKASTKAATTKKTTSRKKKITAEDIRNRAEQIYLERINKGKHGDELSDWLAAEQELSSAK
jgi:hypothetical protein